ncbi:MAG: Cys-tRNA(Pro) deacylase [Desulfobacterium sp.]|nr:Cys-tRNA(Pro) deacylase [Desulfobacterium sp.]
MTPGIKSAKKAKIEYTLHPYDHDPNAASYGEEAAKKLGVAPEKVFKTLVVELDGSTLAVCVIPVTNQLDLKAAAKALGAKKAKMADKNHVQRSTGYVLGGVSPLGQKKRLKTVLHDSARTHGTIYVSAGRRGLDIELDPEDLKNLTSGSFAHIAK